MPFNKILKKKRGTIVKAFLSSAETFEQLSKHLLTDLDLLTDCLDRESWASLKNQLFS